MVYIYGKSRADTHISQHLTLLQVCCVIGMVPNALYVFTLACESLKTE
jgi:hypothetical protein